MQWSFMGFEWVVRDVHKLRDYVEGRSSLSVNESDGAANDGITGENEENSVVADDFEILKQSPIIGDNKFKLEIARTSPTEGTSQRTGTTKPDTLSLYITCLMLDSAYADYEMSASMMTAVKCQEDRVGERGARPDWVWENWQSDWVFREGNEVWACSLPPLSALIENNSRIRETDSLVICIQIHCPVGPFFPSHPTAYYVPKDLLDGLEASLDNPNTGDVRFVCLERFRPDEVPPTPTELTSPATHRPTSSMSSYSHSSQMTARKRIIYAHSDILTRRSEYFATMLSSSFAENPTHISGERKIHTIVVEEADFETIYWLLKYCYANWLLFKEVDDPRAAVEGVGAGWSANWLHARGGEWDWKTFNKGGMIEDADTRSAASGEEGNLSPPTGPSQPLQPGAATTDSSPIRSGSTARTTSTSRVSPKPGVPPARQSTNSTTTTGETSSPGSSRRAPNVSTSTNATMPISIPAAGVRAKQAPSVAVPRHSSNYTQGPPPPSSHYTPISPRASRMSGSSRHGATMISTPDPHVHPTPSPPPASALSMYQIAHRYTMPRLGNLALEHMMSTITPQASFALLLATSAWEDLHAMVEDYIVEKWDEVAVSEEFERCCEEVAAGEWGPEGGKTLMALFRRLRSPGPMLYART
ncbi:hypothetical protein V5O48_014826 [Marasmius crinis-equi]|uniref:BTB domain-containing protein n=1 Tax=Marasmius crinis-equi TaxID=585013 RepID=A0ABR3EW73_9AGAR